MNNRVPSTPPNFSEEELLNFQLTRFRRSALTIALLESGRVVLMNSLREPVAVIDSWELLRQQLLQERTAHRVMEQHQHWMDTKKRKQRSTDEQSIIDEIDLGDIV